MSGWDDTPTPTVDGGFTADGDAGGFSEENTSMHANGESGDAPRDGGCRVCGEDSHFARDCPSKPEGSDNCYNCGQAGHRSNECSEERVEREFTGECRGCGQVGHRRSDCPDSPPMKCNICREEGHTAGSCTANRMIAVFADMGIKGDVSAEDAWKALEAADKDRDVDDIKTAVYTYAKAYPEVTFEELEQTFRDAEMNTYLIAKQQEVADTMTIVNLQGKTNQKYTVSVQFSAKPRRAKFAEDWPSSPEENLTRLGEAGLPLDRHTSKCFNCSQLGHSSKACPEEKVEKEQFAIKCAVCDEEGHRARDCSKPRRVPGAKSCRNCNSTDHIAKDCPEPPNPENVECKNCNEMGHFSRDCPLREPTVCRNCLQEGHMSKDCTNERVLQCRNCDETGHGSRDCPKPRDYSRVECRRCKERGHTEVRCKMPAPEVEEGAAGDAGDGGW